MDMGMRDKIAIVTGASAGIGLGTAMMLAEEGAKVVMLARRPDTLELARQKVAKAAGSEDRVEAHSLDISDTAAYADLIRDVAARLGGVDMLVNNAAASDFGPIEDMEAGTFQRAFRTNVDAAFVAISTVTPIMEARGGGAIVNVSSIMGARCQPHSASYASSKAALKQLSDVAAVELAPKGIRVNVLQVGSIATEGTAAYRRDYPEMAAKVTGAIPLGRWGLPAEIAAGIVFLLSAPASFVSGATLAIDGALSVQFPY